MRIKRFTIRGYRSINELSLRMEQVNLIVGANGVGKSNLYRSLQILHAAASGRLAASIAEEGGMQLVAWAGRRREGAVRVRVGVELDGLEHELVFGFTTIERTEFKCDPYIKTEKVWLLNGKKRICVLDRTNTTVSARDVDGNRVLLPDGISPSESVLSELREPARFPELSSLRQELLGWRFYHQFRTDVDSPLRRPRIGTRTPVLGHDGRDLVSAIQTIREIGDWEALNGAIERAFPGSSIEISPGRQLEMFMRVPGIDRPILQQELSDGTLHYLCLAAAMLSPRPPSFLAINEPEASLHADLFPALADLVARAAQDSQLWITTHSESFSRLVEERVRFKPVKLLKVDGETRAEDVGILGDIEQG